MIPYYGGHATKQFICEKPLCWDTREGWLLHHLVMLLQLISTKETRKSNRYRNQLGLGGKMVLEFLDNLET